MVYKWYILPIGGLYITYHLLREPGNSIDPGIVSAYFFQGANLPERFVSSFRTLGSLRRSRNTSRFPDFHISMGGVFVLKKSSGHEKQKKISHQNYDPTEEPHENTISGGKIPEAHSELLNTQYTLCFKMI